MPYLQKNKRQHRNERRNHIIFVIVLVLVLYFLGSWVRGTVQFINRPLVAIERVVTKPFTTFFTYLTAKDYLAKENYALEQENKKLKIELLTVASLREENASLHTLLSYQSVSESMITARVLQRPPFSPYDMLVLDVGDERVSVGDRVYYVHIPIGYITEVYRNTATARLYSSPDERMFVHIGDEDAEAVGVSDGTFRIKIPKDVSIIVGQPISLIGGDTIAIVEGVEVESSNTFQNVYFKFPFALYDLDFVRVAASIPQ